jgi:hypothetical protein
MQISVLEKLLQLINPKNSQEAEKPLEEILEQETERDEEMQNSEQDVEMQNSEPDVEMQNSEPDVEMQNNEDEKPPHTESNRSHLTSSVPKSAKPPHGILTKGELAEIRALFNNLDDKEIQRLYKQVTK